MPSPRRSVMFAVLVLVAGLAFAGCGRAQPGTAAYVGDFRITESRVDEMVEDVRRSAPNRTLTGLRILVVGTLVMSELATRTAEELSIPVQAPAYESVARSTGLPADSGLARAIAELNAAETALIRRATPVQPTDKDLRDIYEGLRNTQSIPDTASYEAVAQELRADESLPGVLGARKLLLEHAEKIGMEVSPRYRPLTAGVGGVGAPLVLAEDTGITDEL